MPLSNTEKIELEELTKKFGNYNSFVINRISKTIYGQTFNQELVEEDERYDYVGKIDDTPPGVRLHHLGTLREFGRYKKLTRKAEI